MRSTTAATKSKAIIDGVEVTAAGVALKVTAATFEALNFEALWQKSWAPPDIAGRNRLAAPKKRPTDWRGVSKIAEI